MFIYYSERDENGLFIIIATIITLILSVLYAFFIAIPMLIVSYIIAHPIAPFAIACLLVFDIFKRKRSSFLYVLLYATSNRLFPVKPDRKALAHLGVLVYYIQTTLIRFFWLLRKKKIVFVCSWIILSSIAGVSILLGLSLPLLEIELNIPFFIMGEISLWMFVVTGAFGLGQIPIQKIFGEPKQMNQ
jgi:hypothetical protein